MVDLYDPVEAPEDERWFPAGNAAELLVACLQACKDVVKISSSLAPSRPSADTRGLTLLATPVLSLVENSIRLQKSLGSEDRGHWPESDRGHFNRCGKKLRRDADGPLRKIRSKRSAHHDANALGPGGAPHATAEIVVFPLGHALFLLTLCLNHEGVFTWTRFPDKNAPDEMEYFLQVATRFKTIVEADGARHPRNILSLTIRKDPRYQALATLEATIAVYNQLVKDAGYPARQIKLSACREDVAGAAPREGSRDEIPHVG